MKNDRIKTISAKRNPYITHKPSFELSRHYVTVSNKCLDTQNKSLYLEDITKIGRAGREYNFMCSQRSTFSTQSDINKVFNSQEFLESSSDIGLIVIPFQAIALFLHHALQHRGVVGRGQPAFQRGRGRQEGHGLARCGF